MVMFGILHQFLGTPVSIIWWYLELDLGYRRTSSVRAKYGRADSVRAGSITPADERRVSEWVREGEKDGTREELESAARTEQAACSPRPNWVSCSKWGKWALCVASRNYLIFCHCSAKFLFTYSSVLTKWGDKENNNLQSQAAPPNQSWIMNNALWKYS